MKAGDGEDVGQAQPRERLLEVRVRGVVLAEKKVGEQRAPR